MSNNRHLIDDADIVRPAQLLDKGLPIPGLRGHCVVDEGWCAVITEGGTFAEILPAGHHYLDRYHMFRDVKAIMVDQRTQELLISTRGEFSIALPVSVKINLDLSVEYRVNDARRVALEIKTPLTALYDRTVQAVRGVTAHASVEEIRTRDEELARVVLQRLQALNLPKVLGIEVLNVLVTSLKVTDAAEDVLAGQDLKELTTIRDWRVDSGITQQSRITWEWLVMHQPALAQQYLASYGEIAKEMIDKGLLDPAGFLNQPVAGQGAINPMNLIGAFGGLGGMLPGGPSASPAWGGTQQAPPQLPASDPQARAREERRLLEAGLSGAVVELREGRGPDGLADGTYTFRVDYARSSGGTISLFARCPKGYPEAGSSPVVDVHVDGEPTPFQSAITRRWTGQHYLIDIAREVKQYFG